MNIQKKIRASDEIDSQHVRASRGYHTRGPYCTVPMWGEDYMYTEIHEGVKVNDDIEQMFSERSITKYMNTKLNL